MATDILVVDDEADIRELVAGILEDEGFSVRTAANSDAALAAIRARRPALLIQGWSCWTSSRASTPTCPW